MTTIREATPADKLRLLEMSTQFIQTTTYKLFFDVDFLERLVDELLAHHVVFVAERDGRVIGLLALAVVPHILTGKMYADEVAWWVDPEHRSSSAGPRLIHHMEGWIRRKHLHMVRMLAPADSSVGAFYQKCGYQVVETAWIKVFT